MSSVSKEDPSPAGPSGGGGGTPLRDRAQVDEETMFAEISEVSSASGGGGSVSTPFRSPSSRVFYSDRFIPARRDAVDLNYSLLDRDAAAAEVSRSALSREVCMDPTNQHNWKGNKEYKIALHPMERLD